MTRRFNPPPNWPPAPQDWEPTPGWQPEPGWGSAPANWQFWIEEASTFEEPKATVGNPTAPLPPRPSTPPQATVVHLSKRNLSHKHLALLKGAGLVVAGLLVGGFIGAGAQPPATESEAYATAMDTISDRDANVEVWKQKAEDAESILQQQETRIETREEELATAEATMKDAEEAVGKRESAVTKTETAIAESKIGNGLHVVGTDVKAGSYKSEGADGTNSVGCYYAWMSSTSSDADIMDNNIVNGPATVTLRDGEVFESTSCKSWTKVG